MANIPTMETISSTARTHLPSSRCPAPGTSQPASSASAGDAPLAAAALLPVLPPAAAGSCTLVVIETHHISVRAGSPTGEGLHKCLRFPQRLKPHWK